MRISIFALIVPLLVSCATRNPSRQVEALEFSRLICADTSALVLDVRTGDEFAAHHIPHAVNMDYYSGDFRSQLFSLDKNKTIYIYCLSGGRSEEAASLLEGAGYRVVEMTGGINSWIRAGLEVEQGAVSKNQSGITREQYLDMLDTAQLYLIDFHARWCLPCRELLPLVERMDSVYDKQLRAEKIDYDSHQRLAREFQVEGLPYLMLIRNRTVLWSNFGVIDEETLRKAIDAQL